MSDLFNKLSKIDINPSILKHQMIAEVMRHFDAKGYRKIELRDQKPWGAYIRFDNSEAERFIYEFFPDISMQEINLNGLISELSPKMLIISPGKRLSWQWHDRRTEIWAFLHEGYFCKNIFDEETDLVPAMSGDVVKVSKRERHRLVGHESNYTLVAEIWSHTDPNNLSEEDDITRLQDDYKR